MPDYSGITGKILRIDMSTQKSSVIETPEDIYKSHIGGVALGLYWLFKDGVVDPAVKPFDAKNMMQIMAGPMNGAVPGTQTVAVTKAPHNFITIAYSGGLAIGEIKFAGWDGIQVVGKANDLLWVSIVNDKVGFHDAKDIKGKGAFDTEVYLKQRVEAQSPLEYRQRRVLSRENVPTGKDAKGNKVSMWDWWKVRDNPPYAIGEKKLHKIWCIGPGGEKMAWHANLMTEATHAHARYGAGAILGSKNLKAITIRGTLGHKFANKQKCIELIRNIFTEQKKSIANRTYGTGRLPASANNYEDAFCIRNYQYCAWHDPRAVKGLTGAFLDNMSWGKHVSCCSVGCQICFKASRITSADPLMDGVMQDIPDWEAQGNVGGLFDCVVSADQFPGKTPADAYLGDFRAMTEAANRLLFITTMFDDNGLCYIEGGAHLSMLMELRERGLITKEDLKLPADVGDMVWGNYKAVNAMIKLMCTSDDPVYAEIRKGTWETAKYFATLKNKPEIMNYAICTKRYGQPAHDPRSGRCKKPTDYIQTERPCAHTEGSGASVPTSQARGCIVACSFAAVPLGGNAGFAALVENLTGWPFKEADYIKLGDRAFNLERSFNLITQGITDPPTQWDNLWPRRWLDPLPTGWAAGQPSKVTEAIIKTDWATFMADRKWNAKGYPTADLLTSLGISYVDTYLSKIRS